MFATLFLIHFACNNEDNSSPDSENIFVEIGGNRLSFGPQSIQNFSDTCFYDSLLNAYVVQFTYNSIKEVQIGSEVFGPNFIISISVGDKTLSEKEFSIVLPFSNMQFHYLEKNQSVVTFGGYIAKSGTLKMFKNTQGKFVSKFNNIEFFSHPRDTVAKFQASAQIICD